MYTCFESLIQIAFEEETVLALNGTAILVFVFEIFISLNTVRIKKDKSKVLNKFSFVILFEGYLLKRRDHY